MELYKKYRPVSLSEVIGQSETVKQLESWGKNIPHALLFEGASGIGKTTIARIVTRELGVELVDGSLNFREINASSERGVDMVSDLISQSSGNITGKNRVWLLDEVQGLTKQAQQSILKLIEEAPNYAYYIFCTTDPSKLLPTFLNRCSRFKLKPLSDKELDKLIRTVLEKEDKTVDDSVISLIISSSQGSARQALVLLEQCLSVDSIESQKEIAGMGITYAGELRALCKEMTNGFPSTWLSVAKMFDSIKEEPETIRRAMFNWGASALSKGWASKVIANQYLVALLHILEQPTYDLGRNQLLLHLYDMWRLNKR